MARSIWSGRSRSGLVSVPVHMFVMELIRAKAKGQKLPEPKEEEAAEVVDLMAALRESVERTMKSRAKAKKPARAAKSKRAAAR